jgi:glycerol-3-phosphate acyltransferase PlsY
LIDPAVIGADAVVGGLALLIGYLVGSIPLHGRILRAAGHHPAGAPIIEPAGVWRIAGPGWGLLAFVGDVAKGVVPVALGLVTWSWAIGWLAGLGAVLGACRPALGRRPGGRGLAVLGGAGYALAPAAGLLALVAGLTVLVLGRLAGRDAIGAAAAVGLAVLPPIAFVLDPDPVRLAALLALYGVVVVNQVVTRER